MATTLSTEQAFVSNAYEYILNRSTTNLATSTTQADITSWANLIVSGVFTESQIATIFAGSTEATTNVLPIVQLYEAFYHRAPDAAGLNAWVNAYNGGAGMSLNAVAQAFSTGAEFTSLYGSNPTPTAFVAALYQNILGRVPDAAGLTAWVNYLGGASATLTTSAAANIALLFTQSVEAKNDATAPIEAWLAAGVNGTYPATIDGINGGSGSTFALTVDQDTVTGTTGNDTFNGNVVSDGAGAFNETLNNIDQLDGGAGTDTLNVTLAKAGTTVTPVLSNIELINARFTATETLALTASTGVTTVTIANSTAVGTVTGVGSASLAVANQAVDANFDGSTAAALNLSLSSVGTSTANITVDLASATKAAATSLAITANNAYVTLAETAGDAGVTAASIAATGANKVAFSAADAGTITSLTVTGTGSVNVAGQALTVVKTVTAGDGGLTLDTTGNTATSLTVTTGAGADTLTVTGANLTSLTSGAGNDSVTVTSALAATSTIDLGAGNDTVTLNVAPTDGATITGGAGTDTIATTAAIYGTITGLAHVGKITGFETLSVTDLLLNNTVDLSGLSGLTSFQTVGVTTADTATVSHVGAAATITEKGDLATNHGTLTVSLADASGTADALTINLTDKAALAAASHTAVTSNFVLDGIENVTVNTSIQSTTAGVTDATATYTLNIANTDTDLASLTITGSQAVSFTSDAAFTHLATINASAATAGVTIDVSAAASTSSAITITGTVKADTFTIANNADVSGHGGNDTFVITAPTSGQTYSTIEDANTGDVLTFGGSTAFTSAKIALAGTAVFQDFLDAAAAGNATGTVSWFQFGGNTYVVEDVNAATTFQNGSDIVVKLTGAVDLTHATFAGTSVTLA